MPFSSGVFSLAAGNPVVTATTISSTWCNNTLSDVATGLSSCVLKDGTQTITANLPMAGFKFTGLGNGAASGDSVAYTQLFVTASAVLAIPGSISASGNLGITGNAEVSGAANIGTTIFVAAKVSASGAINMVQAANITSTATVALGAVTGNYAVVTGTATISSFDSIRAGTMRVVEFSGATPIDHNSGLILPNATKIAAQAGQVATFISEGGGTWRMTNLFPSKQPTITVLTTGSAATYTTPTGVTHIWVRMVGGGGGGAAEGTNSGANGVDTTLTDGSTTWTAAKGLGGTTAGGAGGAGGAGTNGDVNISGGSGSGGASSSASVGVQGGHGGNNPFGGGGGGGGGASTTGLNATANSGGGGGGAGGTTAPANSGGGGGAGGYVEKLIKAPAASFTYTVGTGGNGGAAGGAAGGNGATGIIIIEEFYD